MTDRKVNLRYFSLILGADVIHRSHILGIRPRHTNDYCRTPENCPRLRGFVLRKCLTQWNHYSIGDLASLRLSCVPAHYSMRSWKDNSDIVRLIQLLWTGATARCDRGHVPAPRCQAAWLPLGSVSYNHCHVRRQTCVSTRS